VRARPLVLGLGAAILVAVFPFIPGLIGALVLYVLARPLARALERMLSPRWSARMTTIVALIGLVVPGVWLGVTVVAEASDALRRLESSEILPALTHARIAGIEIGTQLASLSGAVLSWLSGQAFDVLASMTRATLNLVVALFGLYYLLDADLGLWRRVEAMLPFPREVSDHLRLRFVAVTEAMVMGTILTAVLQGAIVGGAFAVIGLRGAVLWGVITACVSVLPVMGSAIVWAPAVVVLLIERRIGAAMFLGLMGAVIASNLDNVVRLVVYKRVSNVHPMITLVGAFAGVGVFGIAGVILGPLLLLYFVELFDLYRAELPSAVVGQPAAEPSS
jgi:predicted PurR-regulated permease PerM